MAQINDQDCSGWIRFHALDSGTCSPATYLHSTYQIIIDLVLVQVLPGPAFARPTPHVVPVAVLVRLVQHAGANRPDNDGENEEADGEDGIIRRRFLGTPVPSPPICIDHGNRHDQRDASDGQQRDLWPYLLVHVPWVNGAPRGRLGGQVPGRIEDGKGRGQHRHHDETATKAHSP